MLKKATLQPQPAEIAILDFGSQYTHLIARRVRELGVISHIYPTDVPVSALNNASGIILSGGPRNLTSDQELPYDPKIFTLGRPILGLCYGHQLMAKRFGGLVSRGAAREYGLANLSIIKKDTIFKNIPKNSPVWMSHGDHVEKLPPGFIALGTTGNKSVAAMANIAKKFYGFQFHPEVAHSQFGKTIIKNFIYTVCGARKNWDTASMFKKIQASTKQEAGDKNVFLLVSGGVDSTVCFALLEKILGKARVYGLHIDSGFMRLNETKNITGALKKIGFDNLHIYNAENEFLAALKGVTDPETKRKIIGNLYLDIAQKLMRQKNMFGPNWLLGQGTIYPDTIESGGTKNADVIKTHHNRVARVTDMIAAGKVIEPLKELYKDEVRAIGRKLGLPANLVNRHPFPGPGLAIRLLCSPSTTAEPIELLAESPLGPVYKLPMRSVGVQGDERSYSHPAVLTKLSYPKNNSAWQKLKDFSPTVTNNHKSVNRLLLLAGGDETKLFNSSVRAAHITKERLNLLRQIDNIVNATITKNSQTKKIWQLPVVLVPFGHKHGESIVLRPVESEEAMTVTFGTIPAPIISKIISQIKKLKAVDYIFYDLTNKPPGTIEWE